MRWGDRGRPGRDPLHEQIEDLFHELYPNSREVIALAKNMDAKKETKKPKKK